MLDELLGRAGLKADVADLEAEVERLEGQLEGARRRRREAVRARQEADERVNRLEDRVADLEGQLERRRAGEPALRFRGTRSLGPARLRAIIDRLSGYRAPPDGAFTALVEDRPDEATRKAFGDRAGLLERAAPCLALTDDAGVIACALEPAVPPEPFSGWAEGFRLDREWFLPVGEFALAVVRSDLFAYGAFEGEQRVEFEGFESDVMGAHSKGGYSQARFERRREEQVDAHLDRCRAVLDERPSDRLVVVGERSIVDEFSDLAVATAAVDATGDPEGALEDAVRDFFAATLYLL